MPTKPYPRQHITVTMEQVLVKVSYINPIVAYDMESKIPYWQFGFEGNEAEMS
jgi:hypothetical protein